MTAPENVVSSPSSGRSVFTARCLRSNSNRAGKASTPISSISFTPRFRAITPPSPIDGPHAAPSSAMQYARSRALDGVGDGDVFLRLRVESVVGERQGQPLEHRTFELNGTQLKSVTCPKPSMNRSVPSFGVADDHRAQERFVLRPVTGIDLVRARDRRGPEPGREASRRARAAICASVVLIAASDRICRWTVRVRPEAPDAE